MIKTFPIFNSTITKFLGIQVSNRDNQTHFIENVILPDIFGKKDGDFFIMSCSDLIENNIKNYDYYVESKDGLKHLLKFMVYEDKADFNLKNNIVEVPVVKEELKKSISEQVKEVKNETNPPEKLKILPIFGQVEKASDDPIYPVQSFCRSLMLSMEDLQQLELRKVITPKEGIDNIFRYSERDFQRVLKNFNDVSNHQWYTSEEMAEKCNVSVEIIESWKSDNQLVPIFTDKKNIEFYDSYQLQYVLKLKTPENVLPIFLINLFSDKEVIKYTGYSKYTVDKILQESGTKKEEGLYMDSDALGLLISNLLKYNSPAYYTQQELLEESKLSAPTFNKYVKNGMIRPVWTSPSDKNYFEKDCLNTLNAR